MLGKEYLTIALEIFDLHHSLGHSGAKTLGTPPPYRITDCRHDLCMHASDLVVAHALDELRRGREATTPANSEYLGQIDCEETEFDTKGDHDGSVSYYRCTEYLLDHRPNEVIRLCEAHRQLRTTETTIIGKKL